MTEHELINGQCQKCLLDYEDVGGKWEEFACVDPAKLNEIAEKIVWALNEEIEEPFNACA